MRPFTHLEGTSKFASFIGPSDQGLPIGARYTLPENETEMNARLRKLARLEAQKWMI
jgi:hypothetical protein